MSLRSGGLWHDVAGDQLPLPGARSAKSGKLLLSPVAPSTVKERINFSPSRPRFGDDAPPRESENVQEP
jgi:hypothetical protein